MTKFSKRIMAAASAGTMFLSIVTPAAASTTIEITGNGYNATDTAAVQLTGDTTVVQSNNAMVTNNVSANSKTGGNDANQNTGGSSAVVTGDASTSVLISNLLNSNSAQVGCCLPGDTTVTISENGADTENTASVVNNNDIYLDQDNHAFVTNLVDADAKTGGNDANQNTGGDNLISTGKATTVVGVSTTANANSATVGDGPDSGGSLTAVISGNGYNSTNGISLVSDQDVTVTQGNWAMVMNMVDADAKTGGNDANQNTGGDSAIFTGDAASWVAVDNAVNFNSADVDCGCIEDLIAKVKENGADTQNTIIAGLDNDLYVDQGYGHGAGNVATLFNDLYGDAFTGYNDTNQNTGDTEGDPFIMTGDSASFVDVENSGNVNLYGSTPGFDWPEMPEMPDFEFGFDLSGSWISLWHLMGFGLV